jgi:hypothetical protein
LTQPLVAQEIVPVMRGWEDVRDEMGREPIRKLQPQSLVPQVAESMLRIRDLSKLFKGEYPNQICKGNGSALQVEK